MIAYKTFAKCPDDIKPRNIPLDCPWIMTYIEETESEEYSQNGWTIATEEQYEEYVNSLSVSIDQYNAYKLQYSVEAVVDAASKYGSGLMTKFAAENVLLGITQEGKTGEILDKLSHVMSALQAGSLYEAISRVKAIPVEDYDTKYITAARLLSFINEIEVYLGIPISETL